MPNIVVAAVATVAVVAMLLAAVSWAAARRAEARYPPASGSLMIGGYRFHYRMAGKGRPLVLLHGSGASCEDWARVAEILAEDFQTIAIDRPGHGYSERPPGIGDPAAQARLIHQILERLAVGPALIVGHSWSGALALAYALDFPSEVCGLVLVQGTVYPEPALLSPLVKLLAMPVVGPILASTVTPWLGRRRIDGTLRRAFAPLQVPEDYRRRAMAMWLRPSQARAIAADTVGRHSTIGDLSSRYGAIRSPLALVIGEADRYIDPAGQSLALARMLPGTAVHLIPDAGHQLPLTHPEAVAAAIRGLAGSLQEEGKASA